VKFYFHRMRFNEVGTPLKHPETINDKIKSLSKRVERGNIKKMKTFTLRILYIILGWLMAPKSPNAHK
jgi:hypothetical protein